ncbi:MAG: NAD-dependent epimerase/dehydratase family protein [Flavobacteriales bacterium]|nr:MAG: NAD-dependent epimerase/dehydratase family protein [Flavobacteriales bacterium]
MSTYQERILILGAGGQIGTELCEYLAEKHGSNNVIATDLKPLAYQPSETLDATNASALEELVDRYQITTIYHLVAMLSATAEKHPEKGWALNMDTLFHVLNLGKSGKIKKIFWPSSIAVFGPSTPRHNTPQQTIMEPSTVYGISKGAGELWCSYYFEKYGVDVRSIRYPGLISWKGEPGGGTTDYAVDIFYEALRKKQYTCFLKADTYLPMMYMTDAIRATVELMEAPASDVRVRTSYNLAGNSFCPSEIAAEIKKHIPDFEIDYVPDFRQAIADSWPASINDEAAQADWNWKPKYSVERMTEEMLQGVKSKLNL